MGVNSNVNTLYGLEQPFVLGAPTPIISQRDPGANDKPAVGTMWINQDTPAIFFLSRILASNAIWVPVAGGGAIEESITVTTGPNSISGITNINTTTNATTTIGTGGTGLVRIGNATGNTSVTGALATTTSLSAGTTVTAGTGLTVTTGNVLVSTGNITATLGSITANGGNIIATVGDVRAGGNIDLLNGGSSIGFAAGPLIVAGAGAPVGVAPQGSLYLRTNGIDGTSRAYIAVDGAGTWTAIQTAA
jgi:hypothetical protein